MEISQDEQKQSKQCQNLKFVLKPEYMSSCTWSTSNTGKSQCTYMCTVTTIYVAVQMCRQGTRNVSLYGVQKCLVQSWSANVPEILFWHNKSSKSSTKVRCLNQWQSISGLFGQYISGVNVEGKHLTSHIKIIISNITGQVVGC